MKTVKVRIAVAVDPDGHWRAYGWPGRDGKPEEEHPRSLAIGDMDEGGQLFWMEADVPVPESIPEFQTIKATVS